MAAIYHCIRGIPATSLGPLGDALPQYPQGIVGHRRSKRLDHPSATLAGMDRKRQYANASANANGRLNSHYPAVTALAGREVPPGKDGHPPNTHINASPCIAKSCLEVGSVMSVQGNKWSSCAGHTGSECRPY